MILRFLCTIFALLFFALSPSYAVVIMESDVEIFAVKIPNHLKRLSKGKYEASFNFFKLFISLKSDAPLKKIAISNEKIPSKELEVLGPWLLSIKTLKSLSLNAALVNQNEPFIQKLASWLKASDSNNLEELDLSNNPLGYNTAYILEALKTNKGLKRLSLNNTYPTSDMYSEALEESLAQNKTLEFFSFCGNKVPCLEWMEPLYKRPPGLPFIKVDISGTNESEQREFFLSLKAKQ